MGVLGRPYLEHTLEAVVIIPLWPLHLLTALVTLCVGFASLRFAADERGWYAVVTTIVALLLVLGAFMHVGLLL